MESRSTGHRDASPCLVLLLLLLAPLAHAENGYELWLRYRPIADSALRETTRSQLKKITFATTTASNPATLAVAKTELTTALAAMADFQPEFATTSASPDPALGDDGFRLTANASGVTVTANREIGLLYGTFELLRHLQTGGLRANLDYTSVPKIQRRLLNHWDDLDGFVERGYAGSSIWNWFELPEIRGARYRDYARACASIGLNGTVLTNVNANALILTPAYLEKVAALAEEFRPYGIRVYLTARFSAPIEIGGLKTADPFDPAVAAWWKEKVAEIYRAIPDFGGFLVKANSEGQPGPQDYSRTHAEGANLLADALAPHRGIVMWRAFVYSHDTREDRVKQAYNEFQPLDGKFRDNVVVQIKNGPLDFMPREPFSPLFGAMPKTPLALELQITQEYLGGSTQAAFLAPMWEEVLTADTFRPKPGSTVARVIDGSIDQHRISVIAGVANVGSSLNWTGHPLAQANWYAFGRLAWDHAISSETITREWIAQTFSADPDVTRTLSDILLYSREAVVSYSMPLGLHHIMAEGHHYGPGPWVDDAGRADWNSTYYHRADKTGLGFDRTATGSNAIGQYAPELQARWGDVKNFPQNANFLLWFHHVAWDQPLSNTGTLWELLCRKYQSGVDEVRSFRQSWNTLAGKIDAERFRDVQQRLARQEKDAVIWRDACLLYFQQFSQRPLPAGVEPPAHDLHHYRSLKLRFAPGHPGDK